MKISTKISLHLFTVVLVAMFFASVQPVWADTVFLKRGGSIDGSVVEGKETVEIHLDGGSTTFNRTEIDHIEKNTSGKSAKGPGAVSKTLSDWKADAAKVIHHTKAEATRAANSVKKDTSGWFKPIQRSPMALAKERMVNDTLKQAGEAIKQLHARDKAVAEQKRALKQDGFDIS